MLEVEGNIFHVYGGGDVIDHAIQTFVPSPDVAQLCLFFNNLAAISSTVICVCRHFTKKEKLDKVILL